MTTDFHHDAPSCRRCGSSVEWEECDNCKEGFSGHDCGEDCCNCLNPDDNVPCDICEGASGWYLCCSSAVWCTNNPMPGCEKHARGA